MKRPVRLVYSNDIEMKLEYSKQSIGNEVLTSLMASNAKTNKSRKIVYEYDSSFKRLLFVSETTNRIAYGYDQKNDLILVNYTSTGDLVKFEYENETNFLTRITWHDSATMQVVKMFTISYLSICQIELYIQPDEKKIWLSYDDENKLLEYFDLETQQKINKIQTGADNTLSFHAGYIMFSIDLLSEFNSQKKFSVSGSWDQTIKKWNYTTGECLKIVNSGLTIKSLTVLRPLIYGTSTSSKIYFF